MDPQLIQELFEFIETQRNSGIPIEQINNSLARISSEQGLEQPYTYESLYEAQQAIGRGNIPRGLAYGALKGATGGLSNNILPDSFDQADAAAQENAPGAYGAGQIASMLVPHAGAVRGLRAAAGAGGRVGRGLGKVADFLGESRTGRLSADMARSGRKGAIIGGTQGVGYSDETGSHPFMSALVGMGVGGLANAGATFGSAVARGIHQRAINPRTRGRGPGPRAADEVRGDASPYLVNNTPDDLATQWQARIDDLATQKAAAPRGSEKAAALNTQWRHAREVREAVSKGYQFTSLDTPFKVKDALLKYRNNQEAQNALLASHFNVVLGKLNSRDDQALTHFKQIMNATEGGEIERSMVRFFPGGVDEFRSLKARVNRAQGWQDAADLMRVIAVYSAAVSAGGAVGGASPFLGLRLVNF